MCGIAGTWQPAASGHSSSEIVRRMAECISHRGPDSEGVWTSSDASLAIAHRRLAIQDISSLGHQPMLSATERYVVAFNGEIYNFKSLRSTLVKLGHSFQGHSDTEVMLACVEEWGFVDTLPRLTGMFAIALFDKLTSTLWLSRDRIGEKPLYITLMDNRLYFASELRSISECIGEKCALDKAALETYLSFGYYGTTATPYSNTIKLKPGTYLSLTSNDIYNMSEPAELLSKSVSFWKRQRPTFKGTRPYSLASDQENTSTFERTLSTVIKEQSIADVKLGVFLSGGIDSSLVAAMLQNDSDTAINTYTVAFQHPTYNEGPFAEAIAKHLGTNHTEISLNIDDCLECITSLSDLIDEPFADPSFIPTYLISKAAKQHVTVCLSGDGGDELFAGYNRYIWGGKAWSASSKVPSSIRSPMGRILKSVPTKFYDTACQPIAAFNKFQGKIGEKDIGLKVHKMGDLLLSRSGRNTYLDLLKFWKYTPSTSTEISASMDFFEGHQDVDFDLDFISAAMNLDQNFYLPCDNLFKVDRAAMKNSLEVRLPLLDYRIIDFANSLPLDQKIREGKSKWLMREVLYQYVPKKLIERPKMGFSVPLNDWLRKELKTWAENLLLDTELLYQANIDSHIVKSTWDSHLKGHTDSANQLWTILMYLIWHKKSGVFSL